MTFTRKTATIVGVLFIIGTVAGVTSGLVTGPILTDADYLARIAESETRFVLGTLLVLVMGFPLAMVPVMMFPIFRRQNEVLALGAVIFRGALEAVAYVAIVVILLLLLSTSQGYVSATAVQAPYFETMGTLLLRADYWLDHMLAIVFTLGALMLYWLFYRSKLVPRWLSLWGFVGAILYLAAPVINLFDPQHLELSLGVKWGTLMAPLALQEMVFAVWLIVKGFRVSDISSEVAPGMEALMAGQRRRAPATFPPSAR